MVGRNRGQSRDRENIPEESILAILAPAARLLFHSPLHALLFAAGLVELLVLRAGRLALGGALAGGTLLFGLLLATHPGVATYFGAYVLAWLGCVGITSLGFIFWQTLGIGAARPDTVLHARFLGGIFLIVLSLELANTRFLHLTSTLPVTFDHRLALLDLRLGSEPAFVIGRFVQRFHWILNFSFLAYQSLLIGLVSLIAIQSRRSFRLALSTLLQFTAGGVIGGALYLLLPVSGPLYAFPELFPAVTPLLTAADLWPSVLPAAARNGVPSLHTAWVLLFFLNAQRERPLIRLLFGLLLAGTLLATLGLGEHYLLDLVVAVPLGVGLSLIDWNTWRDWRSWMRAIGFSAVTVFWVFGLRFDALQLNAHTSIIPALSILSVGLPLLVRWRWSHRQHSAIQRKTAAAVRR